MHSPFKIINAYLICVNEDFHSAHISIKSARDEIKIMIDDGTEISVPTDARVHKFKLYLSEYHPDDEDFPIYFIYEHGSEVPLFGFDNESIAEIYEKGNSGLIGNVNFYPF